MTKGGVGSREACSCHRLPCLPYKQLLPVAASLLCGQHARNGTRILR